MSAERLILGVLLVGLAVGCVLVLQPFLSAILWAAILVFTTWLVCRWLRARLRLGRAAAAAGRGKGLTPGARPSEFEISNLKF